MALNEFASNTNQKPHQLSHFRYRRTVHRHHNGKLQKQQQQQQKPSILFIVQMVPMEMKPN